jgi:hypothetical protein
MSSPSSGCAFFTIATPDILGWVTRHRDPSYENTWPQPMAVVATPMSDIDVTTFLDSPASVFVGRVECTMPTQAPAGSER